VNARLAVRFGRDERLVQMTHLEALAAWDAALRQARLPVARSGGRSARPRFSLAAPLPLGYTSDAEWAEVHLDEPVAPEDAVRALAGLLPSGMSVLGAEAIPEGRPSLSAQLRWAEYRVVLGGGVTELEAAVAQFFARPTAPWEETVEGKMKRFDLRTLADDLWLEDWGDAVALGMRLDATGNGTGRPDAMIACLGLHQVLSRKRTRLVFSYLPQASLLWRARGRFEEPRPER
jgi:radical SAM-linked protein